MLESRWSYRTHQAVSTLGFTHDACLVERQRTLVALDAATGAVRWQAAVAGSHGWVASSERHVVHLVRSGLRAFDIETGEPRWRRDLGDTYGWLHLHGDVIVVGGWRSYTDIVAIDAADGTDRWTVPARSRRLRSTRISKQAGALMVADGDARAVVLHDLADGAEVARLDVPGHWTDGSVDRPGDGDPMVLEVSNDRLAVVDGAARTVRHVDVPVGVWSTNLRVVAGMIPFISEGGDLGIHSLVDDQLRVLGPLRHQHRHTLPFAPLSDARAAAASSFGRITVFGADGRPPVSRQVGKRVDTPIRAFGDVLVVGTASGEVLGLDAGPPSSADRSGERGELGS